MIHSVNDKILQETTILTTPSDIQCLKFVSAFVTILESFFQLVPATARDLKNGSRKTFALWQFSKCFGDFQGGFQDTGRIVHVRLWCVEVRVCAEQFGDQRQHQCWVTGTQEL